MARLKLLSYKLPCYPRARPYFPSGFREGLLVQACLRDGSAGIGEYAPLDGIHAVKLDQASALAATLSSSMIEEIFMSTDEGAQSILKGLPYPLNWLLSVAYYHRSIKRTVHGDKLIKLSALVCANNAIDAVQEAHQFLAQGYSCLKIKVGKLPIEDEIQKIKRINALAGGQAQLRLDGNKCLSFVEAKKLMKGLKKIPIQYFEEPLSTLDKIPELCAESDVAIALDESYSPGMPMEDIVNLSVRYLIIKPSRFGSLFDVINLCRYAQRYQITPIFSTCFESDFYCALMALIVNDLNLVHQPHGLFCEGFFAQGWGEPSLRPFRGSLSIVQAAQVTGLKGY